MPYTKQPNNHLGYIESELGQYATEEDVLKSLVVDKCNEIERLKGEIEKTKSDFHMLLGRINYLERI